MGVPMMDIRKVRMTVTHLSMAVYMAVCALPAPLERMFVLVVLVVNMPVGMGHRQMLMLMLILILMSVTFGDVKPYANAH